MIIKLNDFESKGDCEENFRNQFVSMVNPDGEPFLSKITGLCCIMGNYVI